MAVISDYSGTVAPLFTQSLAADMDMRVKKAPYAFVVPIADLSAFTTFATGNAPESGMAEILPLRHPDYSNLLMTKLRAERVSESGMPCEPPYTYAHVYCEFESVPYPLSGENPFQIVRLRKGGSFKSRPKAAFKFADSSAAPQSPGFFIAEIGFDVTTYHLTEIDHDAIRALLDHVNDAPILGCSAGTLRFDGVQAREMDLICPDPQYMQTLFFTFRRRPWNHEMKADGSWGEAQRRSGSTPEHEEGDFTELGVS